ncbi:amidase [Bordetella genomosp. 12]|uniref:Amidase n=1 Tax=Bordetella genomosp. 12 TaxID=463035 RepID=A0A261VC70_9BORD|nr:amidase [Bordetella genomosp. 12]OZI71605.1 amidase [Bordetella genomosp. 12]
MKPYWSYPASDLATLVQSGRATAVEIAQSTLERIAQVNGSLNAIVQCDPERVLVEAAAVDAMDVVTRTGLPLAGVPVTIKVTADQVGYATTHGLRSKVDNISDYDSPSVRNMKDAGAVVVGRTNTPAFSYRWFTSNQLHGRTRNPHLSRITAGGSSGGAASAVAAGMGAIAHGTDIAGSVRYPAYACGVHGLRPTPGRIPAFNRTSPSRPIGQQMMGVTGPLARTIADLELALQVMSVAGHDDPLWVPAPLAGSPVAKRAAFCRAPDGMAVEPEVAAEVEAAALSLASAGWEVEEIQATPPLREASELHVYLWMGDGYEAKLREALAEGDTGAITALQGQAHRGRELDGARFSQVLRRRYELMCLWQECFARYAVLLLPVSGALPFEEDRDIRSVADYQYVWDAQSPLIGTAFVGIPGLACATRPSDGVPNGVQVLAGRFREDLCIAAGKDIEKALSAVQCVI